MEDSHEDSAKQGDENDNTCRVCGEKTTSVHYGVLACRGCKGFFARALHNHESYTCPSENCVITKDTRNRCRYCRWRKCTAVGMSKECVKFGRRPKDLKATSVPSKIAATGQTLVKGEDQPMEAACMMPETSTHVQEAETPSASTGDDHTTLFESIANQTFSAFKSHFEMSSENEQQYSSSNLLENVGSIQVENISGNNEIYSTIFERATQLIETVVAFCKALPGFKDITVENQIKILKCASFEVVTIRSFYAQHIYKKLLPMIKDTLFKEVFVEIERVHDRLRRLELTDCELSLVCAILVFSSGRVGLIGDSLEKINEQQLLYTKTLRHQLRKSHPAIHEDVFDRIMLLLPFIRGINHQHSHTILDISHQLGNTRPPLHREVFESSSE